MRSLFIASLMAVAASASNQGESGLAVGTGIEMYHFAVAVALCCPQGVRCGTEADVVSAIEALNAEFEPLRVDFELARLHKFSDVDCLHTNVNEQQAAEILARVHVGGSSTLNVLYLPTALEIDLSGGYARYPPEDPQLRIDQDLEKMDGVRISMNNLYDWKHRVYGKIDPNPHLLPHEVGHWLGLGHDKFTIANLMHPSVGPTYMVDYCFRSDQASQLRTMARRRLAEEGRIPTEYSGQDPDPASSLIAGWERRKLCHDPDLHVDFPVATESMKYPPPKTSLSWWQWLLSWFRG